MEKKFAPKKILIKSHEILLINLKFSISQTTSTQII